MKRAPSSTLPTVLPPAFVLLAVVVTALGGCAARGGPAGSATVPAAGPAAGPAAPAGVYKLSFEGVKEGGLPAGWTIDATNPQGGLGEWKVTSDGPDGKPRSNPATDGGGGKPSLLTLVTIPDASRGHFNLCWTKGLRFTNGSLEAKVRANAGVVDQGGGLIWRAVDSRNYYVARYNPLESNFRLYCVKDGKRTQLADASDLAVKTGEWFTIRIVADGERIEGWLDGKKLLEAADKTFSQAGGVGFWTKADAASSFRDLRVWQ